MTSRNRNILNWVLGALVSGFFIFSASPKLMGSPDGIKMAEGIGLNANSFLIIGIVEVLAAILFLIPRTGVFGTLLLVAYMGGAIATLLEHGLPIMPSCVIAAIVWIVAVIRFPELLSRIKGSPTPA